MKICYLYPSELDALRTGTLNSKTFLFDGFCLAKLYKEMVIQISIVDCVYMLLTLFFLNNIARDLSLFVRLI